jgi:hypothetical protein
MLMKTVLPLFLLAVGVLPAAGNTEVLQSQFEARLDASRVRMQRPVTGPTEELQVLDAEAGLMSAYTAWMAAEEREANAALASLDALRRRSTVAQGVPSEVISVSDKAPSYGLPASTQ